MTTWNITRLVAPSADQALPQLAEVLVDCVEGGASVGFLAPLTLERAAEWWRGILASASRGERIVFVARDSSGAIQGTGQLVFAQPENQPHRADVSKLLVHRRARRTGAGELIMREIERVALVEGRTVLVLDTATPEAERLYDRLGWTRLGPIPNYALNPDGTFCDTVVFWKALA
ncbi:MAG TPA: GNAT family N-acetyltransferase [Tepidiformaceae bacterium]|nr:GNAT family N-acetyltransferase [Tepidiformaceae bacterium]